MRVEICHQGDPAGFQTLLEQVAADVRVQAVMILACDANGFTSEVVDPWLQQCAKPVFGAIFPQIIAASQNLEKGTLVVGLFHPVHCGCVKDLSNSEQDLDQAVTAALNGVDCDGKTVFVFVDGLSTRISALVESLFSNIGLTPNYIGGGGGSLSFEQKACIFTNAGLVVDAAVLAVADVTSGIGVAHGWHAVSSSLKVTESERNRVISLNWIPALEVYRQTVSAHASLVFDDQPFFEIAKSYPLGIIKLDAEMIVRDPIMTQNEELICVGEVPPGSFVYILHGDMESLIDGARQARQAALDSYTGAEEQPVQFFIDCISRVLFMGANFRMELEAVSEGTFTFGALTIGEIASMGDAYLEFYNKTAVVGLLGDRYVP